MRGIGTLGRWLPDIAANLTGALLIVLVLAAQTAVQTARQPVSLAVHRAAPLAGSDLVEALRLRLLRGSAGPTIFDVTGAGLSPVSGPMADGAQTTDALVFILDGAQADRALAALSSQGGRARPVPVPLALGGPDGWHPGFLELASRADSPDAFVAGLQRFLLEPEKPAAPARIAMPEPFVSLAARVRLWANLAALLCGLAVVALLARRAPIRV